VDDSKLERSCFSGRFKIWVVYFRVSNPFILFGEKMEQNLCLCKVDPAYLKYMHSIDSRISVKYNNRPFVGIVTMLNGTTYVLPLTSQTTQERKKVGKKKRASNITTFVKDSAGNEIANILHNNMFPVKAGVYSALAIDAEIDTYESNEIRFIRKNKDKIIKKAMQVHTARTTKHNPFLNKTCCDFGKLEANYQNFPVT